MDILKKNNFQYILTSLNKYTKISMENPNYRHIKHGK